MLHAKLIRRLLCLRWLSMQRRKEPCLAATIALFGRVDSPFLLYLQSPSRRLRRRLLARLLEAMRPLRVTLQRT